MHLGRGAPSHLLQCECLSRTVSGAAACRLLATALQAGPEPAAGLPSSHMPGFRSMHDACADYRSGDSGERYQCDQTVLCPVLRRFDAGLVWTSRQQAATAEGDRVAPFFLERGAYSAMGRRALPAYYAAAVRMTLVAMVLGFPECRYQAAEPTSCPDALSSPADSGPLSCVSRCDVHASFQGSRTQPWKTTRAFNSVAKSREHTVFGALHTYLCIHVPDGVPDSDRLQSVASANAVQ